MADSSSSPARLCGVRLRRGERVVFVDAEGHDVAPGQVVLVELGAREALAMVVFGPSQLVSNEPGVGPAGRLLRAATQEESVGFESSLARQSVEAADRPPTPTEWLVEPNDAPVVQVAVDDGAASAASLIERLFPSERTEASRRTPGSPRIRGEG